MVIETIWTYGSTVWWQRVRYNVSKTELSKLQRLAFSGNSRSDTNDPNSCNGVTPGISSSSCDNYCRDPAMDLQTNVYPTVET